MDPEPGLDDSVHGHSKHPVEHHESIEAFNQLFMDEAGVRSLYSSVATPAASALYSDGVRAGLALYPHREPTYTLQVAHHSWVDGSPSNVELGTGSEEARRATIFPDLPTTERHQQQIPCTRHGHSQFQTIPVGLDPESNDLQRLENTWPICIDIPEGARK